MAVSLMMWRHPRPQGAAGRCIGRTDLAVDRRKAKRLAHRIRQAARRHGWPRVIHSSHLQRCADVGRVLRGWGWRHHIDAAWAEMDFGAWEGLPWSQIPPAEVDAWCQDFAHHAPGGGESLAAFTQRLLDLLQRCGHEPGQALPLLVVGHAGCMQVLERCLTAVGARVVESAALPALPERWPQAHEWGAPAPYMAALRWPAA